MTTHAIYMTTQMHSITGMVTRPSTNREGSRPCKCMECLFLFIWYLVEKENKTRWPDKFTTACWIPHILLVNYCHIVKFLSFDWSIARCCMEETFNPTVTALLWESSARTHGRVFQLMTYLWNIVSYKQVRSQMVWTSS